MTELIADYAFGHTGNSADYTAHGWGEVEPTHRWTVGPESKIRLVFKGCAQNCILVIDALPWCDEASLPRQTFMLAINGRLLTSFTLAEHRTLAFPLPKTPAGDEAVWLTITQLNAFTPRPRAGMDHHGNALGLLLTSLRIFRLSAPAEPTQTRAAFPGALADGSLQHATSIATGLTPTSLALHFESIGQNCEFGLVQRGFGAEPLNLLRFVMMPTHSLYNGVMKRFEGIGTPATIRVFLSDPPQPEFKVQEEIYYLWYATGKAQADTTAEALLAEQCRRLPFLQRKFAEDLAAGGKIHVVTRGEIMTEPEALALYCALSLHGSNTLLWTVHGDDARAGQVDRLRPGFLRGHLGTVDRVLYARWDAWLSVLANAYLLSDLAGGTS